MSDDRQELTHSEGGSRALAERPQSSNFIQMILEAARDPTVDAAKVETMANLAIKLQDRERENQFAKDFAAALMEMPYISKRGVIVIPAKDGREAREQGKFAKFEDLDKVVRPILARHNMVISFKLGSDQGTTATPILTHTNGYRDIGEALKVPPDTSGSKNAAQAIGSSSSYAKRYAMCAALNIITIDEDDDGRGYPLPDDPLTDRQQRLVAEAEASNADGNYAEWYGRQKPKDRAWLVVTGVNARLGGPALPGPSGARPSPPPPPPPPPSPPPPPPPSPAPAQTSAEGGDKKKTTPREWVDRVKGEIGLCRTVPFLDEYLDGKREALDRLKVSDPTLYDEVIDASRYRRDELEEGR